MKNIERALFNSVHGIGTINEDLFYDYAIKNGDNLVDILFNLLNGDLDSFKGNENLDYTKRYFEYLNSIISINPSINKKIIARRIKKLEEKLNRIQQEKKNKISNMTKAKEELDKVYIFIDEIGDQLEKTQPKSYEFISYLIEEPKNMPFIELAFNKVPSLINSKDKDNISLYRNLVRKTLDNIIDYDEENLHYYTNLISMINSYDCLAISQQERRKCLDDIFQVIDKLSYRKKEAKKNKDKLKWLATLKDMIIETTTKLPNIEEVAQKHNIKVSFEERLLNELNIYTTPISEQNYPDRVVIDDYIITIDKEDAIEIDDALSCKKLENGNYLLGVHIASVLGYFPYYSPIVEEAITRGNSIYLPKRYQQKENEFNRVVPLFPYAFSAQQASLLPNMPRLARSYYYEIDQKGNIINQKFLKTIITNSKKTSYKEINDILEHGDENKKLQEVALNLQQVTELISSFYKPEKLYEEVKENSEDYSDLRVKQTGAEKIVYIAMMLTGNKVADFFANSKEGYPCLYRVHEIDKNTNENIEEMIKTLTKTYGGAQYQKLMRLIDGIYPKGWYDLKGKHSGFGLKHYCHCTSALRRSADIVVEHALETCYDKIPTDQEIRELEEDIKKRAQIINSKVKQIEYFTADFARTYKKIR